MIDKGPAKRLIVHVGEQERRDGKPVWELVIEACQRHGLAGATAARGFMGYGASGKIHREILVDVTPDLPITIDAIDTADKIDRLLPELDALIEDGVIAVQDVQLIKFHKSGSLPPS